MNDEIKEKIKAYYVANDIDELLDYITNLQQLYENVLKINQNENKYRTELETKYIVLQQENKKMSKRFRNCKKIKDNYKSRCEKINEILKESPDFNYSNDYIILKRRIESIIQDRSDSQ